MCVWSAFLIISFVRNQNAGLKLLIQINQTDFTNWMSFFLSDLIEKINPNLKTVSTNTGTDGKIKYLAIDALI